MALSVVDAHVREKLIWLRQQQEDMTILLSQVSTACLHCEKTLQQVGSHKAAELCNVSNFMITQCTQ